MDYRENMTEIMAIEDTTARNSAFWEFIQSLESANKESNYDDFSWFYNEELENNEEDRELNGKIYKSLCEVLCQDVNLERIAAFVHRDFFSYEDLILYAVQENNIIKAAGLIKGAEKFFDEQCAYERLEDHLDEEFFAMLEDEENYQNSPLLQEVVQDFMSRYNEEKTVRCQSF